MNLKAVIYICLICVLLLGAGYIASLDNSYNLNSLDALAPIILFLSEIGGAIYNNFHYSLLALASFCLIICFIMAVIEKESKYLFSALAFSIIAQLILVDRKLQYLVLSKYTIYILITLATFLYLLSICLYFKKVNLRNEIENKIFNNRDFLLLSISFFTALILRTYALNNITNYFEGELSPYAAGASSFKGMFVANLGAGGPWAPLGILYYLPMYLSYELWGINLLSVRLSSMLVGVITVPLIFLLTQKLFNKNSAHIAAILFALNCLHIGWSRSDIHPHGATTWPTILVCIFLLNSHRDKKFISSFVLALCMGLTWHQYPSGQSAVAIPILALGFYCLNNFKLPLTKLQILMVFLGILFWFIGLPASYYIADGNIRLLNPFTLTSTRAAWSIEHPGASNLEILIILGKNALENLLEILQGLFYRQPYLFHQEWVPVIYNPRTIAWLELPFIVLSLTLLIKNRKSFETAIIFAWLIAALAPGVMSEQAYPKRLSTFYPLLEILAAYGIISVYNSLNKSWLKKLYLTSFALITFLYLSFTNFLWFSGELWHYGQPAEISVAKKIGAKITAKTLVITNLNGGYDFGKYLFLLLDHLSNPQNRPNIWLAFNNNHSIDQYIDKPFNAISVFKDTVPYQWTKLRNQTEESANFNSWEKILFVLHKGKTKDDNNTSLINKALNRCNNPSTTEITPVGTAWIPMTLIECEVKDLK